MTKVWSVRVWDAKQYKNEPCNWQEWFDLYCSSMCMINCRDCAISVAKMFWAPLKLVILTVVCFSPWFSFIILYSIWTTCVSDTWNWGCGDWEPGFQCVCCHVLWGLFCLPVFQRPYTWLVLLWGGITGDWRGQGRAGKGPGIFTNAVKVLNDEKRGFALLRNKHAYTSTHAQSQLVKGAWWHLCCGLSRGQCSNKRS